MYHTMFVLRRVCDQCFIICVEFCFVVEIDNNLLLFKSHLISIIFNYLNKIRHAYRNGIYLLNFFQA